MFPLLPFFCSLILIALAAACGPSLDDACGLSGGVPSDVAENTLNASLDGVAFSESASVTLGSNGSITAGLLSLIIARDETGTITEELILRRAFPICIPLGERNDDVGQAIYDGTFVSNNNNTGMLSIQTEEEGNIFGRFEVQLGDQAGGGSVNFTEGEFNIEATP